MQVEEVSIWQHCLIDKKQLRNAGQSHGFLMKKRITNVEKLRRTTKLYILYTLINLTLKP